MTHKEKKPALPARIAAWGITFLLTVTLTVAALSGPAGYHRVLTNEKLHIRTATDDQIIREQMDYAAEEIREMAEEYHFSADEVIRLLTSEQFTEINERTARWWTRITSEGIMEEIPSWTADEQIVSAVLNTLDRNRIPEDEREETAKGISNEIEKTVNRTVMPFRKALVTVAVRYINRKTDLPGLIRLASAVPQIAAALSLLLAGMIAFLTGKRIRFSLKYYGAAFAGAGLSAFAGILLIRNAGIDAMIRASSVKLEHQVQAMLRTIVTETWIFAAALFVLGMLFLVFYIIEPGKKGKKATKEPEEGRHAKREDASSDPVGQNS